MSRSLTAADLVAQAACLRVARAIREETHLFCQELPPMNVERFLNLLSACRLPVEKVSLTLVGYGLSDSDLQSLLDRLGLSSVGHASTDLHVAAAWRNRPEAHPIIIALAVGRHPGVSTLAHFPQGTARELALMLLDWARQPEAGLVATNRQDSLLEALSGARDLAPLVSLSGIADFLSEWAARGAENANDAPRRALSRLGLLPDRNLFSNGRSLAERLTSNFALTRLLTSMAGSRLEAIRRRIKKDKEPQRRQELLTILERVDVVRRRGDPASYEALEFEDAQKLINPPRDEPDPEPEAEPEPEPEPEPVVRTPRGVSEDSGAALIDGDEDRLGEIVAGVGEAIAEAIENDSDEVTGSYSLDGQETTFELPVDRDFLTWIKAFCSAELWGGYYRTETTSLEESLTDYRQCEPVLFQPGIASIAHDGELHTLQQILEPMQEELAGRGITNEDFVALWKQLTALRTRLLDSLDLLIQQPMLAIAAKADLRARVAELLQSWERFYRKLAEHHRAMHDIDHAWTRTLFEAVAALDVVQIETRLDAETSSWKAVLLPTHPLHLWRYERMSALARGLKLEGSDRAAVLAELERPEHYLGVIWLTSFPEGRGGNRPLPVARDYHGLAVFENFKNAYSGVEGVKALQSCLRQFALIYGNHTNPLRLALLNPPDASRLLVKLLDVLRAWRNDETVLLVDIYASPEHRTRLRDARRFSMTDRDQIEEFIRSGRLRLRVHDDPLPLEERLQSFKTRPVHIVAVFDEATTAMRTTPGGPSLLPMSPFAMRRRIEFLGIRKKVELAPSVEETVFRGFYDLLGKLDGSLQGGTPQASADAERMRGLIDDTLCGDAPGAFWFFFADRAVPSPGAVRSARIFEQQGRHRRAVCYDATYERLAWLLRGPLDQFNLRFQPDTLMDLLREGIGLVGDGLLGLLKPDGKPDTNRVRGLAGTLIAARDYRRRYPDCLLVSVDSELARLWLRLSRHGERCDLLALRLEGDELVVETIEVKTCGRETVEVPRAELDKALKQLAATLEAVRSGLDEGGGEPAETSPLAAPRQEMLKEVFVNGCQSLAATPADRARWAEWLRALFREGPGFGGPRLNGLIYAVELGNNSLPHEVSLADDPFPITLRSLREAQIQELISGQRRNDAAGRGSPGGVPPAAPSPAGGGSGTLVSPAPRSPMTGLVEPPVPKPAAPASPARLPAAADPLRSSTAETPADQGIRFCVGESLAGATPTRFFLHPSNTKLNQLNIGIVGDLGTGKTQLTKALIYQFTRAAEANRGHRPKFLIFDYKRDYTKPDFVEAVGARVIRPHHIPLNIFDLGAAGDHLAAARLGRVMFLNDCLHRIYGGIGPKQRNQMKTAVMAAYEQAGSGLPSLSDVLAAYETVVGERIDAPYSILSYLADLEVFVPDARDAVSFRRFFDGVLVIDLASLGIGEKERNMLVVLFLNFFYEYMQNLEKRPYIGDAPQLRFIDSMLLVDEADNIMKCNFEVLRQILLQGREFGTGVLLASQYLSHFKTREMDYTEPLLTWFIHKVPNVTAKELESIGLSGIGASMVDRIKTQDVHQCLFKTLDVPGRFMRGIPFYALL